MLLEGDDDDVSVVTSATGLETIAAAAATSTAATGPFRATTPGSRTGSRTGSRGRGGGGVAAAVPAVPSEAALLTLPLPALLAEYPPLLAISKTGARSGNSSSSSRGGGGRGMGRGVGGLGFFEPKII